MTQSFISRSRVILLCFVFFNLILVVKLFLVQIVHSNAYSESADRQYVTSVSNVYERGTIFFKDKDGQLISAATQTAGFKIAIEPNKIIDAEDVYQKLVTAIVLDHDNFITRAKKADDPYEEVANHLSREQADAISLLKIPGVQIVKEKWRFYPGGILASHTLGLVGYKDTELGGRYGLEGQYNKELTRYGKNPYVNFFAEVFSNINKTFFNTESGEGNIVTTIEPQVQSFLEKKLTEVKERYKVDSIGGVIIYTQDGTLFS